MRPHQTFFGLIGLFILLHVSAQHVFARALLGISYPDKSVRAIGQDVDLARQMEDAFGNLVTIHNYGTDSTLLSMLIDYNKLDAALITRQTFVQQPPLSLINLAEIQVTGGTTPAALVLAARSDLPETQQNHLVQAYQELLLSTAGLELLERYTNKLTAAGRPSAATGASPIAVTSLPQKATLAGATISSSALPDVSPTPKESSAPLLGAPTLVPIDFIPAATPVAVQEAERPPAIAVTQLAAGDGMSANPLAREFPAGPAVQEESQEKRISLAADQGQPWAPHVDLTGNRGNDRSRGEVALFLPLMQQKDRMLFADLRFQRDDTEAQEGNFGLGYRQIVDDWILGSYAFYDVRESLHNNTFSQWTVGAEALTKAYDTRFNIYIADEDEAQIPGATASNGLYYLGSNLVYDNLNSFEKSMSGFDIEIGGALPVFTYPEARAYLGGYYFDASNVNSIVGPKARLEIRFADIFKWQHSFFELGGEVRNDSERNTDYSFTVRLRIPLGGGSQPQQAESLTGLEQRMTERIIRDPDIVTSLRVTGAAKPLSHDAEVIEFAHVNNNSGGTGTFETPYGSLEEAAGTNSDIVLLHADSIFTGEGYQMIDDQRMLGDFAGANHLVATDQLGTIALPRASTGRAVPVIRNAPDHAVVLSNRSEVSGLFIRDSATAIYASFLSGPSTLHNIDISGGSDGLVIINSGGNLTMDSSTITGTTASALSVTGGQGVLAIAADITNTAGHSISVNNRSGGALEVSGKINDTGSGINVSDNLGGSVTFNGTSKVVNTTTDDAITLSNNSGSTINFTNGGLNIETTSATGFTATGGGTVNVSGPGNSITTASGTVLHMDGVNIGVNDLTFNSLTTGPVTGIEALKINNVSGGLFDGGDVMVAGTVAADAIAIENSSTSFKFNSVELDNIDGSALTLKNSGSVTITGGNINNTAGDGINAINTSLNIDDVTFGGSTGIGGTGISIIANNVAPISFDISNNTIENTQGSGLKIEAYNGASITNGSVTGTSFNNNQAYAIRIWSHEGSTIDNLTIGDPSASTPGDVSISNSGEEGIYLTAGNDGLASETGTLNVEMNAIDISDSRGETNIVLESLGSGSASYKVTNSHLDGSASLYDNIYLLVDQVNITDTPSLTAEIIGNDMLNGYDAGLTADNYSDVGTLSLYLADNATENGTTEPPFGFALYNNSTGSLTLYNTEIYTPGLNGLRNLLFDQGNTGGAVDLLDSFGSIEVSPLP